MILLLICSIHSRYISYFDTCLDELIELILMMIFELPLDLFDDVKKGGRDDEYMFNGLILKMLINLMIETLILIDSN